jgi:hypothetical protein
MHMTTTVAKLRLMSFTAVRASLEAPLSSTRDVSTKSTAVPERGTLRHFRDWNAVRSPVSLRTSSSRKTNFAVSFGFRCHTVTIATIIIMMILIAASQKALANWLRCFCLTPTTCGLKSWWTADGMKLTRAVTAQSKLRRQQNAVENSERFVFIERRNRRKRRANEKVHLSRFMVNIV